MIHTTTIHAIRQNLSLNLEEYAIADMICKYSQSRKSKGWCHAKNQHYADSFDISLSTVKRAKASLIEKGICEKKTEKGFAIRPTDLWHEQFIEVGQNEPPNNEANSEVGQNDLPVGQNEPATKSKVKSINKKKKNKKEKKFEEDSDAYKLANKLWQSLLARDPIRKEPDLQKWSDSIDKLIRIDGRSFEDCEKVLDWILSHHFWAGVILSADKFRKQFESVWMQYDQKNAAERRKIEQEAEAKRIADEKRKAEIDRLKDTRTPEEKRRVSQMAKEAINARRSLPELSRAINQISEKYSVA